MNASFHNATTLSIAAPKRYETGTGVVFFSTKIEMRDTKGATFEISVMSDNPLSIKIEE